MLKLALRLMRNSVRRKAGADINTVSPLDVVTRAAIPAMFGHGEEDSFINMQHSGEHKLEVNPCSSSCCMQFEGDGAVVHARCCSLSKTQKHCVLHVSCDPIRLRLASGGCDRHACQGPVGT